MATTDQLAGVAPPLSLTTLREPVWGLDPSTLRVALGVISPAPEGVSVTWDVLSLPRLTGTWRLTSALWELKRWFKTHAEITMPCRVMLEQPFGKHVHPISYQILTVVLLAAAGATGCDVELVAPPKWKKLALGDGHGGAPKHEILHWARCVGYTGLLEDEADAIGIATAGAVLECAA